MIRPNAKTVESIRMQGIDEEQSRRYLKPVYRCGCFQVVPGSDAWNACDYHNGYDDGVDASDARPTCGLCGTPRGGPRCTHVWQRDEEVVMSLASWRQLVDELAKLRDRHSADF